MSFQLKRVSPALSRAPQVADTAFGRAVSAAGYMKQHIRAVLDSYALKYPVKDNSRIGEAALKALASDNPVWEISLYAKPTSHHDKSELTDIIFNKLNTKTSLTRSAEFELDSGSGPDNCGFGGLRESKDDVLDKDEIEAGAIRRDGKTYYLFPVTIAAAAISSSKERVEYAPKDCEISETCRCP
jgi:hypothetical protein